jgi:hypothetical protein
MRRANGEAIGASAQKQTVADHQKGARGLCPRAFGAKRRT